jgi:hypothetical protein
MKISPMEVTMKKILPDTEFEYYYSKKADQEKGHSTVDGIKYCERIMKGKKPHLSKYEDLKLVHTAKPFQA